MTSVAHREIGLQNFHMQYFKEQDLSHVYPGAKLDHPNCFECLVLAGGTVDDADDELCTYHAIIDEHSENRLERKLRRLSEDTGHGYLFTAHNFCMVAREQHWTAKEYREMWVSVWKLTSTPLAPFYHSYAWNFVRRELAAAYYELIHGHQPEGVPNTWVGRDYFTNEFNAMGERVRVVLGGAQ